MVFTSHVFIYYFLPLLLLVYYNLPQRARNFFLTLASYVFYGWWNPWFILLMLASTSLNYAGVAILAAPGASQRRRRITLAVSVALNLALLGFFKYYVFFMASANDLLAGLGQEAWPVLRVTLPIGISFFTFQSMSYTIDVYRGDARPARSFVDFACFVSLFPHLVAGPILRYHTLADQLVGREPTLARFSSGVTLFILGFAKKILLANPIGDAADAAFAAAAPLPLDAWCRLARSGPPGALGARRMGLLPAGRALPGGSRSAGTGGRRLPLGRAGSRRDAPRQCRDGDPPIPRPTRRPGHPTGRRAGAQQGERLSGQAHPTRRGPVRRIPIADRGLPGPVEPARDRDGGSVRRVPRGAPQDLLRHG